MPNLSIKNVPESLIEKLRERARRNHRSMQGELMTLVSEAVEPSTEARGVVPPPHGRERGSRGAEEIWRALQSGDPEPVIGAPSAVEIIRADRDGR